MSTRSYTLSQVYQVGEWRPFSNFYYAFINQASGGDPLIMMTPISEQHIPDTATITFFSALFWVGSADTDSGAVFATTVRNADYTTVTQGGMFAAPGVYPYLEGNNLQNGGGAGTTAPSKTTRFFVEVLRATGDHTLATTANEKVITFDGEYEGDAPIVTVHFTLATPIVATNTVTATTISGALLNGTINPSGANSHYPVSYYFQYGTTDSYGLVSETHTGLTGSVPVAAQASIGGLVGNTIYHYRLVAVQDGITTNGNNQSFTTGVSDIPVSYF